jgi:hypothetical protein
MDDEYDGGYWAGRESRDEEVRELEIERDALKAENERLRKIAAKYELLAADGDRCAELVATAYDEWDTDIPWFRQLDCAVAECQQGEKDV